MMRLSTRRERHGRFPTGIYKYPRMQKLRGIFLYFRLELIIGKCNRFEFPNLWSDNVQFQIDNVSLNFTVLYVSQALKSYWPD